MKRGERLEDNPRLINLCTNCKKPECLGDNCKDYAALEDQIRNEGKSIKSPQGKAASAPTLQLTAPEPISNANKNRMTWKAMFLELFPDATYPPRPCMFVPDIDLGCRGETPYNCAKCAQQRIPQHVFDTFRKLIYKEVMK